MTEESFAFSLNRNSDLIKADPVRAGHISGGSNAPAISDRASGNAPSSDSLQRDRIGTVIPSE